MEENEIHPSYLVYMSELLYVSQNEYLCNEDYGTLTSKNQCRHATTAPIRCPEREREGCGEGKRVRVNVVSLEV